MAYIPCIWHGDSAKIKVDDTTTHNATDDQTKSSITYATFKFIHPHSYHLHFPSLHPVPSHPTPIQSDAMRFNFNPNQGPKPLRTKRSYAGKCNTTSKKRTSKRKNGAGQFCKKTEKRRLKTRKGGVKKEVVSWGVFRLLIDFRTNERLTCACAPLRVLLCTVRWISVFLFQIGKFQ